MKTDKKQSEETTSCTTIGTENPSLKTECESTGSQWTRECPQCHKITIYTCKPSKLRADRINGRCRKCAVSETGLSNIGKYVSENTKRRMSISQLKRTSVHGLLGKHHTNESKRKMRVMACKRVIQLQRDNNGRINNIGKNEGQYFSKLEAELGWDGIYYEKSKKQFLIERLGYFVDYYDPTRNIVVEYDEYQHYRKGILREKDVRRMSNIKSYLGCRFLRYNSIAKTLTEY
jgi:very-short-patch-repair endonuclease